MKAAVLGAGPTGVLAASELTRRGFKVVIVTEKEPVRPRGAFYFHALPADLKDRHAPAVITHRYAGNHYTYEQKQWGIHYSSSFPAGGILATDRRHAWWPTEALWRDLIADQAFVITERLTAQQALSFHTKNDLVVITFPLWHRPYMYPTPMVRVSLQSANAVLNDRFNDRELILWPNELFYDGIPHGYHCDIVRVTTPPEDYQAGYCYIELTKTAQLATTHWANRVYHIPDMHPNQPLLGATIDLPDNVILAGRFATGNPKELSSDVLARIAQRLDT